MRSFLASAFIGFLAFATPALAQYPERPVTLIVPFGAGGITDLVARQLGEQLETVLGQGVIVDNRPGAGGALAAQAAAGSAPDGYTLFLGTVGSQIVNPLVRPGIAYDPQTSFRPVGLVSGSPFVIVLSRSLGIETYGDFIRHARDNPGALNLGSAGIASSQHLGLELLKLEEDVDIVHVPFNSGGEAITAAAGGHIDLSMDAWGVVSAQVNAGNLVPIVVGAAERLPAASDIPSNVDVGSPNLRIVSWNSIYAPAQTPDAVIERLNGALMEVLAGGAIAASFEAQGISRFTGSLDEHDSFIAAERKRWEGIITQSNITLE